MFALVVLLLFCIVCSCCFLLFKKIVCFIAVHFGLFNRKGGISVPRSDYTKRSTNLHLQQCKLVESFGDFMGQGAGLGPKHSSPHVNSSASPIGVTPLWEVETGPSPLWIPGCRVGRLPQSHSGDADFMVF